MSEYKATVTYKIKQTDSDDERLGKILINNAAAISKEINFQLAWKQLQQAKRICDYAFANFYGSYDQHMYKRTGGMKNVVDYGIKNGERFTFEFDSSAMGYHRSNEAVYELDFKQGYHGGSRWRTPTPRSIAENGPHMVKTANGMQFAERPWQYWHPANVPKTMAPYKIITTNWDHYIDSIYPKEKNAVIKTVLSKYI